MADREVEEAPLEVPDIPEVLENALIFGLDEAKTKMEQGADVVPFTVLVVKDNLFIESHPGDSPDECFSSAQHTVEGASGAMAYALCYDGYIETDDGVRDAVIAEGGVPGEEEGYAICYLYAPAEDEDSVPVFEDEPAYVGKAPNFMSALTPPSSSATQKTADDQGAGANDDALEDPSDN